MNQEVSQVESQELKTFLDDTFDTMGKVLDEQNPELRQYEIGTVQFVGRDIARVSGLPQIRAEELVRFSGNYMGLVFNIDPKEIGVILLDPSENIQVGSEVQRTKRVLDVPVGEGLLGRVVDPLGRPLDGLGEVSTVLRLPVERPAPAVMDRAPVTVPLQTGIKVIDALIPIGRGQRELILGDRQTGKTAIAVDTIINQKETNIISIYCAVGKKSADVAKVIAELRDHGVMGACIVVVATGEDTPGLQFIAPYAATSMAEYFVEQGRDVLIVYDDLTSHARAYREVSLLLRRPPGREAFPGDIFYIHSRLLERSTHMRPELGGGSLTSLPVVETEAQDMSSYIPTNLISITDGQIYLSPVLFNKGILPAVDVGKSVSRVGGKTQLPAYRSVAGDLRLSYTQFEELESFSRFGTRLDDATRRTLERGWRVREILKQGQYKPLRASEQIASLLSITGGALDLVPIDKIREAESRLLGVVNDQLPELCARIEEGKKMDLADRDSVLNKIKPAIAPLEEVEEAHANN
ncbi:MAG TPA: alternate F1F0 ATPase, F1 subunit alpha [Smithellaceae bacterium]|nr:alternate F1F0 ATPase, F1 subunit alpha [Smithellaceae bacterium]HRS82979.1 alternate F1F0 ATPase, F1 subunit alpha [Smithellaceae bacterium]HRV43900.1 alternate F1F0 ATPase, F1 subunit alpha [Smithellaceae bacterium]